MMPDHMKLVVIRQTAKQYNAVKAQLFRKDIGEIIIATDAGREGELVARWILDKSGCHKPIRRLWISSVTDKAIRDGFHSLKDGRAYDNLYRAAAARAEADWLVGMNGTRALTCKYNAQLFLWESTDANSCHYCNEGRRNPKFFAKRVLWDYSSGRRYGMDMERSKERQF